MGFVQQEDAAAFYDRRYISGYLESWPPVEKKRRIFDLTRGLELPKTGIALDFGCGNGALTEVLRQALHSWEVWGTDISAVAVRNAKKLYPECTFFLSDDKAFLGRRFDFLFTHHVLEHVHDLPGTLREFEDRLKSASAMLHILPCGNQGSFEHSVCVLRTDGINAQQGYRFFYEDPAHVRRLNTQQLAELFGDRGFVLAKEYYSSQYFGAIEWITREMSPGFIRMFTDTSRGVDEEARIKLKNLRRRIIVTWAVRGPATFVESRLRKKNKTSLDYALLIGGLLLYPFGKCIDSYLKRKALEEWEVRKTDRSGSEMYLFFKRAAPGLRS